MNQEGLAPVSPTGTRRTPVQAQVPCRGLAVGHRGDNFLEWMAGELEK